jgi:peptide/nickel transport system substrate-binding protein
MVCGLRKCLSVVAVLLSLWLVVGDRPPARAAESGPLPRHETLYVAGLQWGAPSTWNPVAPDIDWPVGDPHRQLVYETLFAYNMVTGDLEPLLATGYTWVDDATVEVSLQPDARWHDGEPFTSADVVYSYELAKRYELNYSSFWDYVSEVTASDERTVRFTLNPENPNRLMLLDGLCHINMLPRSVFSAKEKEFGGDGTQLRMWTNEEPVGTGPYRLREASAQRIVIERFDDYWGKALWGLPAPKYMVHVIYRGNESGNLALETGDVDVSQQFVPQIWKMWEGGKPVGTWLKAPPYFYVSGSMPSLILNLHRPPLDDVAFRRAMAHAINYAKIAELAMTRYSPTMAPGLISKFGREAAFFDKAQVAESGWSYSPEKAQQILLDAGYTRGRRGGWVMPGGRPVPPLKMECPHGWTDWMSSLNIVSQNLRAIGIDARPEFPEAPAWTDSMQRGDFDMVMGNPSGSYSPAQPWLKFRNAMSARGVPGIGEGIAFWNWGRYENPEFDELLERAARVAEDGERGRIYRALNAIAMRDVPVIPLEYRPWLFYEFNTTHWSGFPTAEDPYAPPQICTDGAGIRALYRIRPVGTSEP